MSSEFQWDPVQYVRFGDFRTRPFLDLISQIRPEKSPQRVVDLGCGTGNQTEILAQRWPQAQVLGIDSSEAMLRDAGQRAGGNLEFRQEKIEDFDPRATDVLVSNAALQWVPGHRQLIEQWTQLMDEGTWIALQVPGNFGAHSHRIMRELAATEPYTKSLKGVLRHENAVGDPGDYLHLLAAQGWLVDAWETTYSHVLQGENPVLEWVRGTGLRPALDALEEPLRGEFEKEYARRLKDAYPKSEVGTVYPFRRTFVVARKAEQSQGRKL